MRRPCRQCRLLVLLLALACLPGAALAERIKDIASVAGVRSNQLVGYGLVVGLVGSGDQTSQTPFTTQSLRNFLAEFDVFVPPGTNLQLQNVAAVSVHAELPPFAKPGQQIDVTVSSVGNAKSLRGGSLLLTPLKGVDGNIYALAQGSLVIGGLAASGADGSQIVVNVPSSGRIPAGAIVERVLPDPFGERDFVTLNLHTADFTSAERMSAEINRTFGEGIARSIDAGSVQVRSPQNAAQRVGFLASLENLEIEPGDAPARVIVNSRSGTVVISSFVRVRPAAVSHGNLTVTISEEPLVSQPEAFGQGRTVATTDSEIDVDRDDNRMFLFDPGVGLDEIVRAVNRVGASPSDLIAILEALKQAGALRAQLVVI